MNDKMLKIKFIREKWITDPEDKVCKRELNDRMLKITYNTEMKDKMMNVQVIKLK
jgi:hypothetical protein